MWELDLQQTTPSLSPLIPLYKSLSITTAAVVLWIPLVFVCCKGHLGKGIWKWGREVKTRRQKRGCCCSTCCALQVRSNMCGPSCLDVSSSCAVEHSHPHSRLMMCQFQRLVQNIVQWKPPIVITSVTICHWFFSFSFFFSCRLPSNWHLYICYMYIKWWIGPHRYLLNLIVSKWGTGGYEVQVGTSIRRNGNKLPFCKIRQTLILILDILNVSSLNIGNEHWFF